jgi:hypothetical protein
MNAKRLGCWGVGVRVTKGGEKVEFSLLILVRKKNWGEPIDSTLCGAKNYDGKRVKL